MDYTTRLCGNPSRPFCVEFITTDDKRNRGFTIIVPMRPESTAPSFQSEVMEVCGEILRLDVAGMFNVQNAGAGLVEVPYSFAKEIALLRGFKGWPK